MLSVPYFGSAMELGKFTRRAGTAVVLAGDASGNPPPHTFPPELAERIASWSADVKLAVASVEALRNVTTDTVHPQDVFIFADGKLCWHSEPALSLDPQSLASQAVTVFISALLHQSHLQHRQHARNEAIFTRVKLVAMERLLKNRARRSRAKPPPEVVEDPYTVLGLPQGATFEQARSARNEMLKQYHPDKVAGLGPKLREVAELETKKINAAFASLQPQLKPGRGRRK